MGKVHHPEPSLTDMIEWLEHVASVAVGEGYDDRLRCKAALISALYELEKLRAEAMIAKFRPTNRTEVDSCQSPSSPPEPELPEPPRSTFR